MKVSRNGAPWRRAVTPYLYLLPGLILIVGVVYIGIGYTGWVSTLDWNGISDDPVGVGLGNFQQLVADPIFWSAIGHVAVFGVITILVQMALGLLMAVLLSSSSVRAAGIYKVIMFVPVVLAPAVIATAFRQILSPDGQFNELLRSAGLDFLTQAWLADPSWALYALAFINIWQWTGFSFILYQAAISQLDEHIFEAAQIDGANTRDIIGRILIPQLNGTHATLVLVGAIGALKTFDIVYLTTGGGPGGSTEFLTTYIYKQAINQFDAGYSAALSMVLLALSLLFTVAQVRSSRER
jgi:raffinose/stachyose/melibiose transport system permease protein